LEGKLKLGKFVFRKPIFKKPVFRIPVFKKPVFKIQVFKKPVFRKPIVVVEIGKEWIKLARRDFTGKSAGIIKIRLLKLAHIKGPVSEAMSKVFKELKIGRQSVITYIPSYLVTTRVIELPSSDPAEIRDMVGLQIGKQTPFSKEEIVFNYKTINAQKQGYIRVMLAVVRRNIVSERVSELEKSGVGIKRVGLSSEGISNWFAAAGMQEIKTDPLRSIILLDIDSGHSDFIVIRKGEAVFAKSITIGSNYLLSEPKFWQSKLVDELNRIIERYRDEGNSAEIEKLFLSGAAGNIKDLAISLGAGLGIPAENTDAAGKLRVEKEAGKDEGYNLVSFSALFGMIVSPEKIRIDLTPPESRIRSMMEEKRKNLTVMGVLLASIVTVISFLFLINIYGRNTYLAHLKSKISQIEQTADEIEKMRVQVDLIEKRLDAKGAAINLLSEIHDIIPREIHFTNINIEGKKRVILKGQAEAMSDVFKFISVIEESPCFKNAKTTYTTTKKKDGVEYASFEIVCAYEE